MLMYCRDHPYQVFGCRRRNGSSCCGCDTYKTELGKLQQEDDELKEIIEFLETGILPEDMMRAKIILLGQAQYSLEEGALYKVELDGTSE